jgi:ABC-2 type transport system permease protein
MNFIQPIITIWTREIIRYWRDKTRIVSSFFQPLMFLVIFGAGLASTLTQGNFGVDFVKFMYPGIIAMSVMGTAFFSTVSTVWDREFGFLKEILVAPISRTSISIGKALGATTIASLQGLILLIIAPFIGVQLHILAVLQLFGLMILLSFAISGIGLLIASLMKTTETFGLVMQVLIFPMFFLSGAFFPLTNVPGWMTIISRINPLTYGVDVMRRTILTSEVTQQTLDRLVIYPITVNVLFLIGFSIVMISAAVLAFNRKE